MPKSSENIHILCFVGKKNDRKLEIRFSIIISLSNPLELDHLEIKINKITNLETQLLKIISQKYNKDIIHIVQVLRT